MDTFVLPRVHSVSDVTVNEDQLLAVLRQQLRWGLLEAEHPDIDMGGVYGTPSATYQCTLVVEGDTFDDCELESFIWERDVYTLVLSYDVDDEQADGTVPRKLILAILSLVGGVPSVSFGERVISVTEEKWNFNKIYPFFIQ